MFSLHHEEAGEHASDPSAFLFRSTDNPSKEPLLSRGSVSKFDFVDPKRNSPFGVVDEFGIYEEYTESGPSSVHFGGYDGTPDDTESIYSPKDGQSRTGAAQVEPSKVEVGTKGQSQLPDFSEERNMIKASSEEKGQSIPVQTTAPKFIAAGHVPSPCTATKSISSTGLPASPQSKRRKTAPNSPSSFSEAHMLDSPLSKLHSSSESSQRTQGPVKADIEMRPKASIPQHLTPWEFNRQCLLAAYSSRLNPYALHPGEHTLLKDHITLPQVSIYLNIRNAILRLWTRNPLLPIRKDEAAGCARDSRYFALADFAYHWLIRQGYINFGCLEIPTTAGPIPRSKSKGRKRSTIVIIGAGVSGLGCARQLEGLIAQYGQQWTERGIKPPKIIVLEGRNRIGGRVFSHILRDQNSTLPAGLRSTAEMGAQIVTGFENGNPMNIIIRGQLALHTYMLKDTSILYDHDGKVVDRGRDRLVEKLYNDVLERASVFRNVFQPVRTAEGDRALMQDGKEPIDNGGPTLVELEVDGLLNGEADTRNASKNQQPKPVTISTEKLTGRAYQTEGVGSRAPAAEAAKTMGWTLTDGIADSTTIKLQSPTTDKVNPGTLGSTMDDALMQYKDLIHLTPQDFRLFNWHNANLEYANAAKVDQLSLTGWDQDLGNEFDGQHSEVVGGYQQVPRGIWQSPFPLDVRFGKPVIAVKTSDDRTSTTVECADGEAITADHVVVSVPLGVLKAGSISFSPALPEFKQGAIDRLGFGLLNKVVMVYEKSFWEEDRDMFGLLNQTKVEDSLNQTDYTTSRGRFFLFWNCIKTSGRPTLVALMAGDSAHQAEAETNASLINDLTSRLRKMFGEDKVPLPSESIVTRWKRDPFACGSYSYVSPTTRTNDYEVMATACGNIHFAGEATCGTHPATVHGAYLSALRAASEVIGDLLGPIPIATPLVPVKVKAETTPTKRGTKRPHYEYVAVKEDTSKLSSTSEAYEASITGAILAEIGDRPVRPSRQGINPYLLYQTDHWLGCKTTCDAEAQRKTKDPAAKASKTDVRAAVGKQWRLATADVKKPYQDRARTSKDAVAEALKQFEQSSKAWDLDAARIRDEYIIRNPML